MAVLCDFCLVVSGPKADLSRLKAILDEHAEEITQEGPFQGYLLVKLAPETWGKLQYHDFFWADPRHPRRSPDETADPTYWQDGNLVIDGTAKWAVPAEFIEQASALFPTLTFALRAWIDNEIYEAWIARSGVAWLVEETSWFFVIFWKGSNQ